MLEKLDPKQYNDVYAILNASFPYDEHRDYEDQRALLQEEAYTILVYREDRQIQGFLAVWDFSDFCLIEHFAVKAELRGKGVGSALLRAFLANTDKLVCLEAELPEDEISARRVAFYQREGFHACPFPYIQPPMAQGRRALPLKFMTYKTDISRAEFERMRDIIHRRVYKGHPTEPALLGFCGDPKEI